jgi:Phage capsid family
MGIYLTKEAPGDVKQAEASAETLLKELGLLNSALAKNKEDTDNQFKNLRSHFDGVKADTDEIKGKVLTHTAEYGELIKNQQALVAAVDQVKAELDAPIIRGGSDLAESDRAAAVELQRRAFLFKGGNEFEFKPDLDNLVDARDYREAARMLMHVGIESKQKILRAMPERVKKAFEASSLDSAFFSPELLGITLDCNITCATMTDLYNSVTVSKSTYMYPQIVDYGAIGKYDCDAKCDAEFGPEGNIVYKSGGVSDFRGVFCFQRKVLAESNYDLLGFMYRAAARSYNINRNEVLITGDGVNEPLGWLTADCFTKKKTATTQFNHIDFRLFFASCPVEYGPVTAVMHQNMFAYLAAMVDGVGRFIYGEGMMTYNPDDVRENIRISNCLPDPTEGLTLGSAAAPFVTGAFLLAVGNWSSAYYAVNKRPLWIEQFEAQSTAWCVKYVLGAEDGGFAACCPAARVLIVGP